LVEVDKKKEAVVTESRQLLNIIKETQNKISEKGREVAELKASGDATNLERDIDKQNANSSSLSRQIANQEKCVRKYRSDLHAIEQKLKGAREEEKQTVKNAKGLTNGVEVTPSGTIQQINAKIKQIQGTKKDAGVLGRDRVTLEKEYIAIKERFMASKRQCEMLRSHLNSLDEMNHERMDLVIWLRKTVTHMVERRFNFMTSSMSKYIGSSIYLDINHKRKELKFRFVSDTGSKMSTEVSSLSGGEKSFAQMCLICALWEQMLPPFRCLDEWDVFLDPVNRKLISKELYDFGRNNEKYQFVFISPQGTTSIRPGDRDKVGVFEVQKSL